MQPRQLRRAHGGRALVVDQLDDALAEDGVLLDHLGQVIAGFQPIEGVDGGRIDGLFRRMAGTDVVEKVGQLVEELRQGIEQHRLSEVLGRLEHPHRLDPVGEDPFPVRAQEIGEPARLVGHGPLLHELNVDITASHCKAAWRESQVASLEAPIRSPNAPVLALAFGDCAQPETPGLLELQAAPKPGKRASGAASRKA